MTDENEPIDRNGKKKINLALKGHGSHGAFTWGVLDFLPKDERLDIEAITGTSAGAMNAVVLAEVHLEGGRAGGRNSLANCWQSISDASMVPPPPRKPSSIRISARLWRR
jgi:NTE family protein